ncbi:MAG TPA: SCO family protein [Duganella sp.]|nr:SCO family protein [Duganella sp.]
MKPATTLRHIALAATLLTGLAAPAFARIPIADAATTAPGASLYRLDTALTDGAGQRFTLGEMAGAPVLVTMFYGDCHAACPIIIETLKRTVAALGAAGKPLRVVLISLDPQHDTPASLAMLASKHDLDAPQFRLAVAADESRTRTVAAALNIKYRRLDNGEINHTTRVLLLDGAGTQVASSSRLEVTPDPVFVAQIAKLLKTEKTGSDQGIAK